MTGRWRSIAVARFRPRRRHASPQHAGHAVDAARRAASGEPFSGRLEDRPTRSRTPAPRMRAPQSPTHSVRAPDLGPPVNRPSAHATAARGSGRVLGQFLVMQQIKRRPRRRRFRPDSASGRKRLQHRTSGSRRIPAWCRQVRHSHSLPARTGSKLSGREHCQRRIDACAN
jgi:hypothetical protein